MNPVQLGLTLDEVNVILDALGRRPFAQVHNLIAKIQQQAVAQIGDGVSTVPNRNDQP